MATPVPPSPDTSKALLAAFGWRDIKFVGDVEVRAIDAKRGTVSFDNGSEIGFDLLLGVPAHRAPDVVQATGLCVDGYVPVDTKTLETKVPGVYAIGDCATQGTPKAGVFAEGAARAVAASIVARLRGGEPETKHTGKGSCYIEFGAGRIGRVDIDFLSGPKPSGTYHEPSVALRAEKDEFGASRRRRWFGRS
jgi:sulfide:quinone oxidoreductase